MSYMTERAVTVMERNNIEYLLSIFRELTTELPQELVYHEDGDIIELKSFSGTEEIPALCA